MARGWKCFTIVIGLVAFESCNLQDPTSVSQRDLITVDVLAPTLLANGVARTEVIATLREDTRDTVSVKFTTEAGKFVTALGQNTKEITMKAVANRASVVLESDTKARAVLVRATARGFSAVDSVLFTVAKPENLRLRATRLTAAADGAAIIPLVVELTLNGPGTVTEGRRVDLAVFDSTTLQPVLGLGRTGSSNAEGRVDFSLVSTTPATLKLVAIAADTSAIKDSVWVQFTSPPPAPAKIVRGSGFT